MTNDAGSGREAPTRVVLCEDQEPVRALVEATLEGERYSLVEACDGDECLALCRREQPDVIVLDMVMPGRSGLDVLGELRADPSVRHTPVVVLTAVPKHFDATTVSDLGADAFLTKPFSPWQLLAVIDDLSSRTGEQAATQSGDRPAARRSDSRF